MSTHEDEPSWNVERLMERGLDREDAEFICGEEWTDEQRARLVRLAGLRPMIAMPELTPEQQKAFEEEWSKPYSGNMSWIPNRIEGGSEFTVDHIARGKAWIEGRDPGPAIGEHLTDIDADEAPSVSRLYARIRDALETIVDRYSDLEAQLQAEGAHTEAANAEIERLKQTNQSHPD